MEISNKWLRVILILVFIGIVSTLAYVLHTPKPQTVPNQAAVNKPKPSIYSLNGTVASVNGSTYTMTLPDGKTTKTFTATSATKISKQTTTKTGLTFPLVDLNQLKVGSKIVIYSKNDPLSQTTIAVTEVIIVK